MLTHLNACRSLSEVIRKLWSSACDYKNQHNLPGSILEGPLGFSHMFCFRELVWSWNYCGFKDVLLRASRMSEATPEKVKRLGVSPQIKPPKDKWLWFKLSYHFRLHSGIGSHPLTLHKRQRVACAGYLKQCPNGVIYPWEIKGEKFQNCLGTQGVYSAQREWENLNWAPEPQLNKRTSTGHKIRFTAEIGNQQEPHNKIFSPDKKVYSVQHWNPT